MNLQWIGGKSGTTSRPGGDKTNARDVCDRQRGIDTSSDSLPAFAWFVGGRRPGNGTRIGSSSDESSGSSALAVFAWLASAAGVLGVHTSETSISRRACALSEGQ